MMRAPERDEEEDDGESSGSGEHRELSKEFKKYLIDQGWEDPDTYDPDNEFQGRIGRKWEHETGNSIFAQ